jgi:hypothetical protein
MADKDTDDECDDLNSLAAVRKVIEALLGEADTGCRKADGERDLQFIDGDCRQTIHVEVFGPFGLHQDLNADFNGSREWIVTHLRSPRPVAVGGISWRRREMATLFIDGLRALPILWEQDAPDVRLWRDEIDEICNAILIADDSVRWAMRSRIN